MNASVSVIIPCFRSARTIGRAIESVARQTVRPREVILVEDASGDDTLDMLRQCQAEYGQNWIKIFVLDRNSGPAAARNLAWDNAKSEYIACLDADDAWHPEKVEIQYNWMKTHPEAQITGHPCIVLPKAETPPPLPTNWEVHRVLSRTLLLSNQFSTPTAMLRRELPIRFAATQRYSEDYLLWLRMALMGHSIYFITLPLTFLFKTRYGASGLSGKLWGDGEGGIVQLLPTSARRIDLGRIMRFPGFILLYQVLGSVDEDVKTPDKMRIDHFCFGFFLLSLLIAPKVPFPLAGISVKSAASLGAVGLLLWTVLRPQHITGWRSWSYPFPIQCLLGFAVYALVVSLLSMKMFATIYAVQYFFYLCFSVLILSSYVRCAIERKQLNITYHILAGVGLIFALGVIVSLWTGPIYPHLTQPYERFWGGLIIQQGVGFSEGTNGAGATLIIICAFYWYVYRHYQQRAWLFGVIGILGLLATISRSSIVSFCFGVILWAIVGIVRAVIRHKVSRRSAIFAARVILVLSLFGVLAYLVPINIDQESPLFVVKAAMVGFGVDDQEGVVQSDTEVRIDLWKRGIDAWAGRSLPERLVGQGFRGSLDSSEEAWGTFHNAYIGIMDDFGVIGVILFIVAILGSVARLVYAGLFSASSNEERAALVMMAGMALHNTTELFFYSPVLMSMIILILVFANVRRAEIQKKHRARELEFVAALSSNTA